MKKKVLKLKIFITNVLRIIVSFLFVNMNFSYANNEISNIVGLSIIDLQPMCYAGDTIQPATKSIRVLIILVPIALIIGFLVIYIKKKKTGKIKENEKNDKK